MKKTTIKKLIALIIAGIMVMAVIFGGCGNKEKVTLNAAALKGPTGLGIVKMMEDNSGNDEYSFMLAGTADEIKGKLLNGELDIAAVPTNLASVLYNKTEGKIKIAAVTTLGVLYLMENGNSITQISDISDKTIYASGMGSAAQYVFEYILRKNGLDPEKLDIQYVAEHSALASMMVSEQAAIAVLPQPFVSSVLEKNSNVRIALDLQEEWKKVTEAPLAMGCVVVRSEYAEQNPKAVADFLEQYKKSSEYAVNNVKEAAALSDKYGIMTQSAAEAALPYCNIVFLQGEEMKTVSSLFLKVLFEQNAASIGGKEPDENFYYEK